MIINNKILDTINELKVYINELLQDKQEDEELYLELVELISEYELDNVELKCVVNTLYKFYMKSYDVELTKDFLYIA